MTSASGVTPRGREDRAQRAVGHDVAVANGVVATSGRRAHFRLVEVGTQCVDYRQGLIEVDGPDADGRRRHDSRVPAAVRSILTAGRQASAHLERRRISTVLTFASDTHRQHCPRQPFHDQGHMIDPPEVPRAPSASARRSSPGVDRTGPRARGTRHRTGTAGAQPGLRRVPRDTRTPNGEPRPTRPRTPRRFRTPGRFAVSRRVRLATPSPSWAGTRTTPIRSSPEPGTPRSARSMSR